MNGADVLSASAALASVFVSVSFTRVSVWFCRTYSGDGGCAAGVGVRGRHPGQIEFHGQVWFRDVSSGALPDGDVAGAGEFADRLPDGEAVDSPFCGEFGFGGQPLAGGEFVGADAAEQFALDLAVDRATAPSACAGHRRPERTKAFTT